MLSRYNRVLVAFSGGTDSTLLLFEAARMLGAGNVLAATAVSELFPPRETQRARGLCKRFRVEQRLFDAGLLQSGEVSKNGPDRCYFCKKKVFMLFKRAARDAGADAVLDGSQTDDRADTRPGARAAAELGILSPLDEAGFDKNDVRVVSRFHGLPTADLPAAACLASRVPYGTALTKELLGRIDGAEEAVRKLGFRCFRVRVCGENARLEFDRMEMERAFRFRRSLVKRVEAFGWISVSLDLKGYRTGSMNEKSSRIPAGKTTVSSKPVTKKKR